VTAFFDQLEGRARNAGSLLCVGLDPRSGSADEALAECQRLIEATAEHACAFKANSAFFERHGAAGFAALREIIAMVPAGIPVLLDAKRGDIGETSGAYAAAAFDMLGAHAITVSPYLGEDAVAPFLARPDRGAFVLCKTSNPGAGEFQDLAIEGRTLYEVVAERVQRWAGGRNAGLVVGATDPAALARVRAAAPGLWFLVPGVGAQGGDLRSALEASLREDGLGLLINVSRSIAGAPDPGREARRLKDAIRDIQKAVVAGRGPRLVEHETGQPATISNLQAPISILANMLLTSGCVRFGRFTLRSGSVSPIYLDLRRLVSRPEALREAARAYAAAAQGLNFDRLAGIPYAGLPIATALALEMGRPLIYARREAKDYGTRASIEGDFVAGETVLVIDDLATTGGTKVEAIQKLAGAGLMVRDILVLIDREQGAREALASAGYQLHAVTTLPKLLEEWRRSSLISADQHAEVSKYLSRPA
jgi:uridine monophosphate synthetase